MDYKTKLNNTRIIATTLFNGLAVQIGDEIILKARLHNEATVQGVNATMAKKFITTITNYDELNLKFKLLAEAESNLVIKENQMTLEILTIEEKYRKETESLVNQRNALYANIKTFCEDNKKDFDGNKRTVKLLYGTVGFKYSSGAIQLLKKVKDGFRKSAIDLKDMFHTKYVRMVPEINKEKLLEDYRANKIGDLELASVNLKLERGDYFTIKFDSKKLTAEGIVIPVKKKKTNNKAA